MTPVRRRPVIGIPSARYSDSWYTPANGNAISYLRAIEAAGGIPAIIHQTRDVDVLAMHYQRCDGLIFAGGVDIDPSCYQAARHPQLQETSPDQDALELALAERALADGKPVFGICRGIQLLNVAMGGTLYQDIPSEIPGALNHNQSTDVRDMAALAHPIDLDQDSWLARHLDAEGPMVNTLHHQAIRDLAPGLRIVAHAPDGVVEAVEGTRSGFVLGVQSHPEEMWERTDPRWARVFSAFVEVCRPAS